MVGLSRLVARFDTELKATQEFNDILARRRPPHDPEFAVGLTIDLQAEVRQLQVLDDLGRQMAEGFADIRGLLNPQPPLGLRLFAIREENRFFYGAQAAPFVGRDRELAALHEFLGSEQAFAWWLVTGSGGQGKSRLALELCLRNAFAWRVGFLQDEAFEWHKWQPEKPTLIVIDYPAAHAEQLGKIARGLYQRRNGLDFPVRFLLLERESGGTWFDEFQGTGGDRFETGECRYQEPHVLGALSDDALWATMQSFWTNENAVPFDRGATLEQLRIIDKECRPLFAALLADALAADRSVLDWNKEAVIRDVLQRWNIKFWRPIGVTQQEMHLLALATMTGGFEVANLREIGDGDLLPKCQSFSPDRYSTMVGRSATKTLAPLEPDIIGELFVLETLKPRHAVDDRADALRELAWRIAPASMFFFLSRVGRDFTDNKNLRAISRLAAHDYMHRAYWSKAAFNLILDYCIFGDFLAASELYKNLADLAISHSEEAFPREWQAKAACNLMAAYGEVGEFAAAWDIYLSLLCLVERCAEEVTLQKIQAKGIINLISICGEAGELSIADNYFAELIRLAQSSPNDTDLRAKLARISHRSWSELGVLG